MALNIVKGNMYGFVTHTWNAVKGICPHQCAYCYMSKRGKLNPARLDESELKADLGENNTIFVGSSIDMWAEEIPNAWIDQTILHCQKYPNNKYFFQSKNPSRFFEYLSRINFHEIGIEVIFCTTIETNRFYAEMGKTITPELRSLFMKRISGEFQTHITLKPIMDFDLDNLLCLLYKCNPSQVNIGADSKGCKLVEPDAKKLEQLIFALSTFTQVYQKPNLKRLLC